MNLRNLIALAAAGIFLSACVSTAEPEAKLPVQDLSTPVPTVSTLPASQSASPSIKTKGTKIMTATLINIKTPKGVIEIELYPTDAPKTVENFATLASQGYYNGLTFHRVEPGFVIQGGDPKGNGTGGTSVFGDTYEDELNPQTKSYQEGYKEGVVAMANRGPNTNGSQFFIMLADNALPHAYTIFGKVVKGIDVVKQIAVGDKMEAVTIVK